MPVAIVARSPRSTVLCLALAGLTTACGKAAAPAPTGRPPAVVSVATAEAVDVPLYIDEIGRCVATEVVAVQPRVSGQVVEVLVKDGQDVEEDATLFRIDPRPYDAALAQVRPDVAGRDHVVDRSVGGHERLLADPVQLLEPSGPRATLEERGADGDGRDRGHDQSSEHSPPSAPARST